jgi:hypothetical protein
MTKEIMPLHRIVKARRELAETVAKGKQGFGDCGIVELNEAGDGVVLTHGPKVIELPFKAAIELRDLLIAMFPSYYDCEFLSPEPAQPAAPEVAHD